MAPDRDRHSPPKCAAPVGWRALKEVTMFTKLFPRALVSCGLLFAAVACGGGPEDDSLGASFDEARRPIACERSSEAQCLARPNACVAEYLQSSEGTVTQTVFAGCRRLDPCERLDEAQCLADATCEVVVGPCPLAPCAVGESCECRPTVLGCRSKGPQPPTPPPGR